MDGNVGESVVCRGMRNRVRRECSGDVSGDGVSDLEGVERIEA